MPDKSGLTGELYRDAAGEWRWRIRAANGNIVATSGEGYANKGDCAAMLERFTAGGPTASETKLDAVVDVDPETGDAFPVTP